MNISVNQFQKTFYFSYWCALKGPQDFVVGLTKNGKLDLKQFVNHDSLIYQSDKNTTIDTYCTSKEVRFTQDPTGTTIYFEVDGWFPINEILEFTKRYPGIVFELSMVSLAPSSVQPEEELSYSFVRLLDGHIYYTVPRENLEQVFDVPYLFHKLTENQKHATYLAALNYLSMNNGKLPENIDYNKLFSESYFGYSLNERYKGI